MGFNDIAIDLFKSEPVATSFAPNNSRTVIGYSDGTRGFQFEIDAFVSGKLGLVRFWIDGGSQTSLSPKQRKYRTANLNLCSWQVSATRTLSFHVLISQGQLVSKGALA
jgi:hypothetical protein